MTSTEILPRAYRENKERGYLNGECIKIHRRERWIEFHRETPNLSRGPQFPPLSLELIKPSDRYHLHEIKAAHSTGAFFAAHERKRETREGDVGWERGRGETTKDGWRETRGMHAVIFLIAETYCRGSLRHSSGTRELQGERRECKHRCRCRGGFRNSYVD